MAPPTACGRRPANGPSAGRSPRTGGHPGSAADHPAVIVRQPLQSALQHLRLLLPQHVRAGRWPGRQYLPTAAPRGRPLPGPLRVRTSACPCRGSAGKVAQVVEEQPAQPGQQFASEVPWKQAKSRCASGRSPEPGRKRRPCPAARVEVLAGDQQQIAPAMLQGLARASRDPARAAANQSLASLTDSAIA